MLMFGMNSCPGFRETCNEFIHKKDFSGLWAYILLQSASELDSGALYRAPDRLLSSLVLLRASQYLDLLGLYCRSIPGSGVRIGQFFVYYNLKTKNWQQRPFRP